MQMAFILIPVTWKQEGGKKPSSKASEGLLVAYTEPKFQGQNVELSAA